MTKRPEKAEFEQKYRELEGNKKELAKLYNASLQSIYNWIEEYIEGVESNIEEGKMEFDDYVKIHKDSLIKPRERQVKLKLNQDTLIVCMSDTHLGSTYVDAERLSADLKLIRDTPGVYAVFVGDIIDWSPNGPKDLLYDQIFSNPKYSKDWAREMVKTISHKMIAIVSGCHDKWQYRDSGEYFGDELAEFTVTRVFVPDALILDIQNGKIPYRIFMSHKIQRTSPENLPGAMLKKARTELDFDVGIQAHFHKAAITTQYLKHVTTVVNCGSYKKVDTFASALGITEHPIIIPGVFLSASEKKVIPFIDWRDGIKYLGEKK